MFNKLDLFKLFLTEKERVGDYFTVYYDGKDTSHIKYSLKGQGDLIVKLGKDLQGTNCEKFLFIPPNNQNEYIPLCFISGNGTHSDYKNVAFPVPDLMKKIIADYSDPITRAAIGIDSAQIKVKSPTIVFKDGCLDNFLDALCDKEIARVDDEVVVSYTKDQLKYTIEGTGTLTVEFTKNKLGLNQEDFFFAYPEQKSKGTLVANVSIVKNLSIKTNDDPKTIPYCRILDEYYLTPVARKMENIIEGYAHNESREKMGVDNTSNTQAKNKKKKKNNFERKISI